MEGVRDMWKGYETWEGYETFGRGTRHVEGV